MPVAQIHFLLRSHRFNEVASIVEEEPAQATALNSAKQTPIAVLIGQITRGTAYDGICRGIPNYVDGFQDAFEALVRQHPMGVANVDRRGDTALTIACRDGRAYDLDPSASAGGTGYSDNFRALLRWAIEVMIDVCPSAARIHDRWGKLPLDHIHSRGLGPIDIMKKISRASPNALIGGGPINDMLHAPDGMYWDRVKPLLSVRPAAAAERGGDSFSSSPLQTFWERMMWRYDEDRDPRRRDRGTRLCPPDRHFDDIVSKMTVAGRGPEYWRKAMNMFLLLLRAGYYETTSSALPGNAAFRAVHAAAGLQIPANAVRLAAKLYPQQLLKTDEDEGRTPLHIASAGPYHSRGFDEIDVPTGLELLARASPSAARMMDQEGRLPLHLAIRSGKTWRLGLNALVRAAPRTLRVASADRGMYPFAEAAIGERANVDSVYLLLRVDPSVLDLARGV